ncbi:MAG: ArnT family glycosyltransferase [Planctomycetota bacterium]|jgi:4-amino-4-deoxy-L-arabinose transferase-like glycosyltransferase
MDEDRAPATGDEAGSARIPETWRRAGLALVLSQLLLLLHGAWRVGPTYDEHFYIASGYSYLTEGDYTLNREHPPLLKLMAGAPLLLFDDVDAGGSGANGFNFPVGFFFQRNGEHLRRNLFAARVPFCLLTAGLTWAVFVAAARRFGGRSGFAAALLLALNPNVLAHGRLAALDAGVAAVMFFAAVAFVDLLRRPSAGRALIAGIGFGVAQLAKFTSLLLVPLFGGLALLAAVREKSVRPLWNLARVVLVGLTVFAIGYGFESKAANEAWNRPAYAVGVAPEEVDLEALSTRIEEEFSSVGLGDAQIANVLGSVRTVESSQELVAIYGPLLSAGTPEGAAEAAARSLDSQPRAPGDLRKEWFGQVLRSDVISDEVKLEVLPRIADRVLLGPDGDPLEGADGVIRWGAWFGSERYESWDRQLFIKRPFQLLARGLLGDTTQIPLFSALRGIDYQLYHGDFGHGSYYRGTTLNAGSSFQDGNPFPEYYADVMGLKNPLAFLVAVLLSMPLALVLGSRFAARPWTALEALTFLGLPLLAFYLFSTGNALMGVRYVLPIFPFLALLVGRLDRALPWSGVVLAGIAALESLWIHPHELMYFNLRAGGPVGGPAATVVGDDWGQDALAVGDWYAEHRTALEGAGGLFYTPYSMADREALGLGDVQPLTGPVQGIVAVHAIQLYRDAQAYRWLEGFEPFERLGWSVYFYDTREPAPGGRPDLPRD